MIIKKHCSWPECRQLHPGEVLLDEIEARKFRKSAYAIELDILLGHLSVMFMGNRSIGALIAVKLEKALSVSTKFWLGLQGDHDLAQARRTLAA